MRVLLTSGMGLTGAVIRFYCWSWVAHAALVLDDGTVLDATPSRGVAIHTPDRYAREALFTVDCDAAVLIRAEEWARGQVGKPYDWSAIYGFAARRDWRNPNAYFCSELLECAFEAAGFPLLRELHVNRVTPRDLLLSPRLRPV